MSIQSLYNDISMLNASKVHFMNIVNALNNTASSISNVGSSVSSICQIDDSPLPIATRCGNLFQDISNTSHYIYSVIIPTIDRDIVYKKNEILREEARMRARR